MPPPLTRRQRIEDDLKNLIKQSLEDTAIQGIPGIFKKSNRKPVKVLWSLSFLVVIIFTGMQIMQSIANYADYNVVTTTQTVNVYELPFPVVSLCSPSSPNTNGGIYLTDIKSASFLNKEVDYEKDFESYSDPMFGQCVRFNSGRSMNQRPVPFKTVKNRGIFNSLYLQVDPKISLRIWISNETVDSVSKQGTVLTRKTHNEIALYRTITSKQPKPYSQCTYDLTELNSYQSETYKKTFSAYTRANYHYKNCINMCKQKNLGEQCGFQIKEFGQSYFTSMQSKSMSIFSSIAAYCNYCSLDEYQNYTASFEKDSKCYETNANPSAEYLKGCDCPLECKTYDYSFSSFVGETFTDYTEIVISYDDMEEKIITESIQTTTSNLIGNIGGIAGLFTGFSFLCFAELIAFLMNFVLVIWENMYVEVGVKEVADPNDIYKIKLDELEDFIEPPEEESALKLILKASALWIVYLTVIFVLVAIIHGVKINHGPSPIIREGPIGTKITTLEEYQFTVAFLIQSIDVFTNSSNNLLQLTNYCKLNIWNSISFIEFNSYDLSASSSLKQCQTMAILSKDEIVIGPSSLSSSSDNLTLTELAVFNFTNGNFTNKRISFTIMPNVLITFDSNGKLVGGDMNGNMVIYDVDKSELISKFKAHTSSVNSLLEMPELGYLASASDDPTISIWDLNDNFKLIANPTGHSMAVRALALLPKGQLVSASADRSIIIWESSSWIPKKNLFADQELWSLNALSNGNIASGDNLGNISVWYPIDGRVVASMVDPPGEFLDYQIFNTAPEKVSSMIELPNGFLAVGCIDASNVNIWRVEEPQKIASFSLINNWPLRGHLSDVISGTSLTSSGSFSYRTDYSNNPVSSVSLSPGYLQLPPNVYFRGDFTFAVWAKFDRYEQNMRILDCASGNGASNNIVLTYFSNPYVTLESDIYVGYTKSFLRGVTRNSFWNYWNHYAFSLQGNMAKMYLNGNLLEQGILSVPISAIRSNCYIGRSNFASDPQKVHASFSDIRVYNISLSQSEIQRIIDPSLRNAWPLKDDLSDVISGESLTSYGSVSFASDRFNNLNSAVHLSPGYLQLPADVYFSGDFTFVIWASFDKIKPWTSLIDCGQETGNNVLFTFTDLFYPQFEIWIGTGPNITKYSINQSKAFLKTSKWIHFALTLNKTIGSIYLNGNQVSQGNLSVPSNVKRSLCFIGKPNMPTSIQNVFASFSDIKIYSRALSQNEIQNLINPSLINDWPLDGNLNDLILGSSLTSYGNVSYTSDHLNKPNSALHLSPGYLELPADVYFRGDFTFAIWAKFDTIKSWMRMLDCASVAGHNIVLTYNSDSRLEFELFVGFGLSALHVFNEPLSITTGVWNHYAITLQGDTGTIYFNGNILKQDTLAFPISVIRTNCFIGRSNFASDPQSVNASLSGIKIYSKALSKTEIQNFLVDPFFNNNWPLQGNLIDAISGESLTSYGIVSYTTNRLRFPNAALSLSPGYLQFPFDLHFNGDFTYAFWASLTDGIQENTRVILIDCLSEFGANSNIGLRWTNNSVIDVEIYVGTNKYNLDLVNQAQQMSFHFHAWNHYAFTLQGTLGTFYLNGRILGQRNLAIPSSVMRTNCYIGKSNFASDPQSIYASLSDIKIYSRALIQTEIQNTMGLVILNDWRFQGDLNDALSSDTSLLSFGNVSFTSDFIDRPNSAVYLSPGYLQLPADVYFSGDFTFAIWANFDQIEDWMRIIDCAGTSLFYNNNVVLSYDSMLDKLEFEIFLDEFKKSLNQYQSISTGVWNHFAITLQRDQGTIYLNGLEIAHGTLGIPNAVNRAYCYIGKSNYPDNPQSIYASLSEMKIFKGALSATEIQILYDLSFVNYWPLNYSQKQRLTGDLTVIYNTVVLPSTGYLLTGSMGGSLTVWNADNGTKEMSVWASGGVLFLAILENNNLAVSLDNGEMEIRDSTNLNLLSTTLIDIPADVLYVMPTNGLLVAGLRNGTIVIYDPTGSSKVSELVDGHTASINSILQVSSLFLASAGADTCLIIWKVNLGFNNARYYPWQIQRVSQTIHSIFLLDNENMAMGTDDSTIYIWNTETWNYVVTLSQGSAVTSLLVLDNGYLASGDQSGNVIIWDVTTTTMKRVLFIPSDQVSTSRSRTVWGLTQLNSGLLTCSFENGNVYVWEITTLTQN